MGLTSKMDIVMWTKNGESFLTSVLRRIEDVFPHENISNKIMIDDHSIDNTAAIAKSYNWKVFENPKKGVSAGANEALRLVNSEKFVSIEQDLVLAEDWWDRIPPLLENEKVVAASGVRLPDRPVSLRLISEYTNERNKQEMKIDPGFRYGKTLDNTIYKTDMLRKLGGFPNVHINAGVDGALAKRINGAERLWKVDFDVVSLHLRRGIMNELNHSYWYGTELMALTRLLGEEENVITSASKRAVFSPLRGLQIASKKKCPEILLVYPLIRLSILLGVLNAQDKSDLDGNLSA